MRIGESYRASQGVCAYRERVAVFGELATYLYP